MDRVSNKLESLLDCHDQLDELFLLHQEAVLHCRTEVAIRLLAGYRRLLGVHMRHEEEHVLPLYVKAGEKPRFPSVLFTGQHQKLNEFLDSIEAALAKLPARMSPREAIALITYQASFKHLLEHHDGAEREALFPVADGSLDDAGRAQLLDQLRDEWRTALSALEQSVLSARTELGASQS